MVTALILGGAAVGSYILYKVWPAQCKHADAKQNYSTYQTYMRLVAAQAERAQKASTMTPVLSAEISQLAQRNLEVGAKMVELEAATPQTLGVSSMACEAMKLMNSVLAQAAATSKKVGDTIGEGSVIPPPPMSTTTKLLLGGAVLGGGYLAYRYWWKPQHGGIIPRRSLPRYAGGTRRLKR